MGECLQLVKSLMETTAGWTDLGECLKLVKSLMETTAGGTDK